MKSKKLFILVIVAFLFLLFHEFIFFAGGEKVYGEGTKKQSSNVTNNQNDFQKEGFYKYYIVPFFPIVVILITVFGGAFLSNHYWKKRESFTRKKAFIEEKTKSFLTLSSAFAKFHAYTDLLQRLEKEKENFIGKQNHEALNLFFQIDSNYQVNRNEAFSDISSNINYAKIFFSSALVIERIKRYLNLYDSFRKDPNLWGSEGFSDIISKSRNIVDSMKEELKDDLSK